MKVNDTEDSIDYESSIEDDNDDYDPEDDDYMSLLGDVEDEEANDEY